jgi:ABC-type dipeptide/oligopeptide/nickel transport system permease subunit
MEAGDVREQARAVGVAPTIADPDLPAIAARTPWEAFRRRFREDKLAMASLVFLAMLVLVAIFAPLIVKVLGAPPPNEQNPDALNIFGNPTGPSAEHWFGVDQLGRDVFSRTLYGARVSLLVAVAATGFAVVAGVIAGLLAGYFRGWVDTLISRSVDVLLAIPYLLLAIGLAATCSVGGGCFGGLIQPGVPVVVLVISFTSWTFIARIVRGETLSLREKEFVEASRSLGASERRIIFREVLPNLAAPIIVYTSVLVPQVILYEAALSFLGVGVVTRYAIWWHMMSDGSL